jgi:hypothetical protein
MARPFGRSVPPFIPPLAYERPTGGDQGANARAVNSARQGRSHLMF